MPRKWTVNPALRYYGIAAILFSLLSAVILYIFSLGYGGTVLWLFGALSILAGLFGIAMTFLGARQDPEFIHSFALRGTDELYHVLTWIPGREADFKTFPDNLTPGKLLEKRKTFADVAAFVGSDEFDRCVRASIEEKVSDHPLRQYVITRRMLRPKMTAHFFDYDVISYATGSASRPNTARLYRKNDGYDRIILIITGIRENSAP